MLEERILATKAEVHRLLDANIIREVIYPEWLANVVQVLKKNSKTENVYRLYISQQSLCERLLPLAKNRHVSQ